MQLTIDDFIPTLTIDGREYRATNKRLIGNRRKWADVEYYHPGRGWRRVENWDRITQVADMVWLTCGIAAIETTEQAPAV